MKTSKYSIFFFGCFLWSSMAKGQLTESYRDTIKNWTSIIDSLIQQDDNLLSELTAGLVSDDSLHLKYDHVLDDLDKSIIHYNKLFCGGGTAYLFEAKTKKVVKIFYDSGCGDYWVEKNIYFKDGKVIFAKVFISDRNTNPKQLYGWEEYYKDDKVAWTTSKNRINEEVIKDIKSFDSIKEGYKLLHDFKPELN